MYYLVKPVLIKFLEYPKLSPNLTALCPLDFCHNYFFSGTAFGKGCYFAVQSSYSVGFTKRGRGMRYGCIFLSMVLTGDYTQGRPDMKSPPEKSTDMDEKHLFDSVVDNINNPTMFVVFKDSSVYPSYLITFS